MGSGTNRRWWAEFGSRSGRKSATKSKSHRRGKTQTYLKAKARRAEAKRRASG